MLFRQPSSQSIALNRVLGQNPSVILGNLSANGQVFVLNPNGVLFGRGARVSVGALLASTLQISVEDFLAGRFTLTGGDSSGSVINRGTLEAHDGGHIALIGSQVINEGVNAGGGSVSIGGVGTSAAYVASSAVVHADALWAGDGGDVVVWANESTRFAGTITARGGASGGLGAGDGGANGGASGGATGSGRANGRAGAGATGGDGGHFETSGAAFLDASGSVDASAVAGRPGSWLLAPYNVTLSTAATTNGSFGGGVFTPSATGAVANVTTIQTALNGGTSVTINTAGPGTDVGNITVANAIAKTAGASTLSLNAENQITFNTNANLTSTAGALNIVLNAGAGGITNIRNINTDGGVLQAQRPSMAEHCGSVLRIASRPLPLSQSQPARSSI